MVDLAACSLKLAAYFFTGVNPSPPAKTPSNASQEIL